MNSFTTQSINTISIGNWTNVAVKVDQYNNTITFLINGQVDSQYSFSDVVDLIFDGTNMMIGTDLIANDHYIGNISDLSLYNGCLSLNKIDNQSYDPILMLGYRFNTYMTANNYINFNDISFTNSTLVGNEHMDLVYSYKNNKKGVKMNTSTYLTTNINGKFNVNFGKCTISTWIYLDTLQTIGERALFFKDNSFYIYIDSTNNVVFDDGNTVIRSDSPLSDKIWYHLVITFSNFSKEIVFYLNGIIWNISSNTLLSNVTNKQKVIYLLVIIMMQQILFILEMEL